MTGFTRIGVQENKLHVSQHDIVLGKLRADQIYLDFFFGLAIDSTRT